MVAVRRTLTVNCRRCGRSVERVRRADDQRNPAQLEQSARCGFCYARAADGDLELFLRTYSAAPPQAGNARPGWILEPDAEFHIRSVRNGGTVQPQLRIAKRQPTPPRTGYWRGLVEEVRWVGTALGRFWRGLHAEVGDVGKALERFGRGMTDDIIDTLGFLGRVLVGLGALVLVSLPVAGIAVLAFGVFSATAPVVGNGLKRTFDYVTAPAARELTYNLDDPAERTAFCFGRAYLVQMRGADVPENVREMRRQVLRHCPELATY